MIPTYLVHSDWLPIQLDHVHDLDRIVGVLFAHELHKPVSLVHLGDAVPGNVDIDWNVCWVREREHKTVRQQAFHSTKKSKQNTHMLHVRC